MISYDFSDIRTVIYLPPSSAFSHPNLSPALFTFSKSDHSYAVVLLCPPSMLNINCRALKSPPFPHFSDLILIP